jgi:hypothetical protein
MVREGWRVTKILVRKAFLKICRHSERAKSQPPKIFGRCNITDQLVGKPRKQAQLGRNVALGD